jgi:ketosteroid isomerase-like protein
MDAREIVVEVLKLWSAQDIESTFVYVAEDVVYALHFDEELAPFAGVTYGRDAMMGAFYKMIEEFDYLEYKPVIMSVEKDQVRVHTRHRYHHRRTGSEISGSYRTVFTVRDGQIVRCEEYVDRGLVEAFMRLTRQREAANDIVPPPELPKRPPREEAERPVRTTSKVPDNEDCK